MALTSKNGLSFCLISCLVLVLVTVPETEGRNVVLRCWDTWSRCTRWSYLGTGRIWLSCDARCKELNYKRGACVEATSACPLTKYAYQCQCSD